MNAFLKRASMAIATASMPFSSPAIGQDSDNRIFVPPISAIANEVIAIESPVDIGGVCTLTPTYLIRSNLSNPAERAQHQQLISEWAAANATQVGEFAEALSIATFQVVREQNHSAADICQNAPAARSFMIAAFTASGQLFTRGLMQSFPNVIKDGTAIEFTITGFTEAPAAPVNTGIIAAAAQNLNVKLG